MNINKLILELYYLIASKKQNRKKNSPLSEAQIKFLKEIQIRGTTTITKISEQLNIKKPTATIAIQNLISMGYLEKIPSPKDKRSFRIRLTPKGEDILSQIHETDSELLDSLTKVLTKKELLQFGWLLNKIVESNKI